jgi:hypothetical protein
MRRREFITLLGGAAAWPVVARAQLSEGARQIGVLMGLAEDDPDTKARLFGLRQSLEKLGWVEGRNLRIDYRFAPAGARVEALAKELVALRPDVILSNASPATAALQRETSVIPIVFTGVADPIGSGFALSPELRRRYDPGAFPDARNYGCRHCETYAPQASQPNPLAASPARLLSHRLGRSFRHVRFAPIATNLLHASKTTLSAITGREQMHQSSGRNQRLVRSDWFCRS